MTLDNKKLNFFSYISLGTITVLGLYISSLHSYLLFHSLIEILTISIAFTLFILTWNTRKYMENNYLRLLGIGYVFIAMIDLLHTLAYKGMNVFPAYGANLPTQLWIAARYFQAVTLIAAPLLVGRRIDNRVIFTGYIGAVSTFVAIIFSGNFPDCFIDGKGLTTFKINSEYIITILLLFSLFLLYRKRKHFNNRVFILIASSIICTVISEMSFTAYISVFGFANMVGHFAKLFAFYLIYQAILVTGLRDPFDLIFRDLKQAEEALQKSNDTLEEKVRERIAELHRLNRELRAVSNCNQVLVRADDEQALLNNICRIISDEAGYCLVWVGYAEHDDAKTIRPVAWAGSDSGYVTNAKLSWSDDTERGRGPGGESIRSGKIVYIQDITTDPQMALWRESALQRGYHSVISLPLKDENANEFGVLLIYSTEINAFTPDELRLLEELAGDLAFGIVTLHARAERRQAEVALHTASIYARSLIEASLDPLVTISVDGKITDVNLATESVTGVGREQLIFSDFSDYFTEPEKARTGYQQVLAQGLVRDYPLTIRHISGKTTDVLYNATVYKTESGEIQGVFAAARDITALKRAEQKAIQLASIVESSEDAIIGKSLDGIILSWNNGAEKVYGYTENEVIGKSISIILSPGRPDEVLQIIEKIKSGEHIAHYETVHRKKDGKDIHIALTVSPIRDTEGRIVAASTIGSDITKRKEAEEALHTASLYARSLIEASLDPLVTISADGKITDVNLATESVTGVGREQLINSDFSDYFTEPDKARAGYQQVLEQGFVRDYPLTIRHTSGKTTDVLYNATIYRNESGELQGVFAAARDITKSKQAEEEIRKLNQELEQRVADRTSQLEAANKELEAFAYSVSHDLRAPLRHISGFVDMLSKDLHDQLSEKSEHYLNVINDSALKMGKLIDDLLSFSRTGRAEMEKTTFSMNQVVEEAKSQVKLSITHRNIDWEIANLPEVFGDYNLLRLVWVNLLDNAIKYTRTREKAVIHIDYSEEKGEFIFSIRDNGVGFDMKYAHKLFGVFQRLHSVSEFEGTGIGLANVRRIILKHGGRTWAEAELNKEATFYFSLPNQ